MIEAKQLTKIYGKIKAVNNISFKVEKGDVLGFLGPNGAGKSTTMKMLTGFVPPTFGTALIGGLNVKDDAKAAKKLFGYLPENGPLYEEMTVFEFLDFIANVRKLNKNKKQSLDTVIERCFLKDVLSQPIETLSKGFRQRVGMAQALIHDPAILILDEPTDGLDPNQKREVRKLIKEMASEKAIILSTHILEEVEAICNRVIIIDKGELVINETPDALKKRHPHFGAMYITIEKSRIAIADKALKEIKEIKSIEKKDKEWLILPHKKTSLSEIILNTLMKNNISILATRPAPTPLDDVFSSLTSIR